MCSPSTMTWHIKWRAKDWTSCFSPSRFPQGDHDLASTSQMQVTKNMAFEKKKDNIAKSIRSKNLSPASEKCDKKRQPNNLMDKEKEGVLVENKVDDDSIRALSSSDENYIVFSFREDGEFDVFYDCESGKCEAHGNDQNSRRVNRKLDYGEGAEQVSDNQIQESISNANQNDNDQEDQDYIATSKENEEKETITLSQHREDIRRTSQIEKIEDRVVVSTDSRDSNQSEEGSRGSFAFPVDNIRRSSQTEETEDGRVIPADSRDSNLSEASRGSFAFPVLGWEIVGSPVKMPKSEDMHLKKQKIRCVRFQCFRF